MKCKKPPKMNEKGILQLIKKQSFCQARFQQFGFDVMLEIKDKEKRAIKAINLTMEDLRAHNFCKIAI
jgi:hypothetical protein